VLSPLVAEHLAALDVTVSAGEVAAVTEVEGAGDDTEVVRRRESKQAVSPAATEDLDLAVLVSYDPSIGAHFQISGRALSHDEKRSPELMPCGLST
jgi:hypothetical protein